MNKKEYFNSIHTLLRLLAALDIGIEALTRYNIEKEIETELMSPYFEYVVAE